MNLLRPFFHLFWVACCALTLMAQTRWLLGISLYPDWSDGFVFGGTVFGYYCTHPNRRYRVIAWGVGIFGGLCFLMPLIDSRAMTAKHLIGLAPVLFWLAYYGFERPGNAGLRKFPVAKPLTIALTWAWVTVLLPTPVAQWSEVLFLLLGRTAFIFALALAYDLSDADYDRRHGLETLTEKLGFEKSFTAIYLSLGLAALCVCVNVYLNLYPLPEATGLLFSLLFSAWWLRFLLNKAALKQWQKACIDGLMVLQFLLVFLCSMGWSSAKYF